MNAIYTERDIARGYAIDIKRVFLAYFVESIIVVTSLIGAWLFAVQYGRNETNTMLMMMLAPIAYAVVEFCRVPLAIVVRKPSYSLFIKLIIVMGLLGAACVTIKSISQLGEIMFRPRLIDVVHAGEKLTDAKSGADIIAKQIADADAVVQQRKDELVVANQQLDARNAEFARLPEQKCSPTSGVSKNGHAYKGIRCIPDPRIGQAKDSIAVAVANQKEANSQLDKVNAQRSQFDRTMADNVLRTEKLNYREAVMNSQLHSFTAIFFGKEPTEVTDGEIHFFLRFFVFLPAIGAAFSATIIALTALTKIKPETVDLPDQMSEYVLSPLAEEILRDATAKHIAALHAGVPRPLYQAAE